VDNCTELRIGASEAALTRLRDLGVPEPDTWTYVPYSVQRLSGTGQAKGFGFPRASWAWQRLDQMYLYVFQNFFSAATEASVQVYITTYIGTGRQRTTANYTAYMQRPLEGEAKTMVQHGQGNVWDDITIQFTHLEAV
jgi:hypothetical protein